MNRNFNTSPQIVIPTEKIFFVKNGKRCHREKILFPGYLFIETLYPAEVSQILKSISGATGLLKNKSGELQTLKKYEIGKILGDLEKQKDTSNNDIFFSMGEEVKVIYGPFEGFQGHIEDLSYEKQKVKVSVPIFGRATIVDLDLIHIEKLQVKSE